MTDKPADSGQAAPPANLEIARIHSKMHLWETVINGITSVAMIASLGIPMYFVYQCVAAIAGKTTIVSSNIVFGVSGVAAVGSGSAVAVGGWAKFNAQRKELVRLRTRITQLENRLKKARGR